MYTYHAHSSEHACHAQSHWLTILVGPQYTRTALREGAPVPEAFDFAVDNTFGVGAAAALAGVGDDGNNYGDGDGHKDADMDKVADMAAAVGSTSAVYLRSTGAGGGAGGSGGAGGAASAGGGAGARAGAGAGACSGGRNASEPSSQHPTNPTAAADDHKDGE